MNRTASPYFKEKEKRYQNYKQSGVEDRCDFYS